MIKRAINEFFWVAGPKVLAGGLQFALSLILLRYFGPAEFGIISVCMAAILLGDSIIGGATDSGVLRLAPLHNETDPQRSLRYQQAGLALKLIVAMPLALPVVVFARQLSVMLFQEAQGESYLALTIAALMGMLALRSAQMHFQVHGRFTLYGVTDLLNTVLRFGGIAALLLLAVPSTWQVLAFFAFAPIAVTVGILLVSARPLISSAFSTAALSELAATVKWYMATAATGTLISRMDIFLVSAIASVSEAGILSAAQAIALVPQLVGTYIAVVFSPRIMPMWQAGTLKPLYQRFQFAISGVALLAFAIAWFAVSGISDLIFPAAFARSGETILVLLPAGLAALVNFPLTILLVLFLRPKFLLAMDCVLLPLLVATYLWVIPRYGAIGAAAVTSASALLKTGIMQTLAWRLLSSQPVEMAESFEPQADPVPEEVLNA